MACASRSATSPCSSRWCQRTCWWESTMRVGAGMAGPTLQVARDCAKTKPTAPTGQSNPIGYFGFRTGGKLRRRVGRLLSRHVPATLMECESGDLAGRIPLKTDAGGNHLIEKVILGRRKDWRFLLTGRLREKRAALLGDGEDEGRGQRIVAGIIAEGLGRQRHLFGKRREFAPKAALIHAILLQHQGHDLSRAVPFK